MDWALSRAFCNVYLYLQSCASQTIKEHLKKNSKTVVQAHKSSPGIVTQFKEDGTSPLKSLTRTPAEQC